jgi:SAM-dependent methyltransferase
MNTSEEINRLGNQFNWTGPNRNQDGVRVPDGASGTAISFPDDSWDDQEINYEGMGVWADIRLREIHRLMVMNGISTIWEVGAGNGAVCIGLSKLGHNAIAVEPLYGGARYIAEQGLDTYCSILDQLKLPDNSIPSIGVFDVLEHIENPVPMLEEFARVLKKDGLLLITVPAHQFLFSEYDSSIGHFRRYSVSELRSSLAAGGFELVSSRFLFAFLVPLAWLLRVLPEKMGLKSSATSRNSTRTQFRIAQLLSPIFRLLVAAEKLLRLPFGLSILAVARPKS